MKNYARKTNRSVVRYRTPATFRVRAVMATNKSKLDNHQNKRVYIAKQLVKDDLESA